MESGHGRWPAQREREATSYRVQRAEIAALLAGADTVRRRAKALRMLPDSPAFAIDVTLPAAAATPQELADHAEHLRSAIATARRDLEWQVSEAFTSRLLQKLEAHGKPGDARELLPAQRALADNLTRCDPGDVEYLERLALGLAETGSAGLRELERSLSESVDRAQRAMQATMSRERIKVLIADVLADEHVMLTALLASTPDQDLPALMNQVQAAVVRADRHWSQIIAADAVTRALRDLGLTIGPRFAAHLAETGAAILPLADGHGVRVSVSGSSVNLRAARRAEGLTASSGRGSGSAQELTVRDLVGQARARLIQAGILLDDPRPADAEAVLALGGTQWDAECDRARQ
jgi:hypothetical protein